MAGNAASRGDHGRHERFVGVAALADRAPEAARETESVDPRVSAVLEVLAGETHDAVAQRWAVEPALLHRWVRSFVEAGTAQVTNRPSGEVARERDRFLSVFLHGLRAPLAEAQGWVGLLHSTPVQQRMSTEVVDRLQATIDLLHERALDVELLTAAMLGRISVAPDRARVRDLTAALLPASEVGGEGPDVEITVDVELFARALRDLWHTVATTAPRPLDVRFEVRTVEPWLELRIIREGDPIEPRVLHRLFEPFEYDDVAVTAGLYLARALTVAHGGTVGVEQDDDEAVFWLRVPDRRIHQDPPIRPVPPVRSV
ncbi:sensor histidine kinase [Nocardioides sp.]|uniref:sensor histidine kinase n=1 Tax=Nocardioides sp. TaxID=35761 RepID=UPI003516A53D